MKLSLAREEIRRFHPEHSIDKKEPPTRAVQAGLYDRMHNRISVFCTRDISNSVAHHRCTMSDCECVCHDQYSEAYGYCGWDGRD